MAKKLEITGKAVIYTSEGVKVVDAEVRRKFNVHADYCEFKFNYDEPYLLIGGARTVETDNIYAQPAYNPQRVQQAKNYGESKFFSFMLKLMGLAQWQAINKSNTVINGSVFYENRLTEKLDIDYNQQGEKLDAQSYKKYDFTPAMIKFLEAYFK